MNKWKKESENLNIDGLRLSVWEIEKKKIEEKWTEPQDPVGHPQMDQHTHNGSPRRRGQRERNRKNPWINNEQNHPNLMENTNLHVRTAQQIPSKINSKRPTLDAS